MGLALGSQSLDPDHAPSAAEPGETQASVSIYFHSAKESQWSHSNGENKLELNETETQSPGSMTAPEHCWWFYVSIVPGGGGGGPTSSAAGCLANGRTGRNPGPPEVQICRERVAPFKLCPPLSENNHLPTGCSQAVKTLFLHSFLLLAPKKSKLENLR